jgi:Na+-transporting methylmalonyl-CoA/oxaloacetate decarboxylase gamma subunit
MQTIKFIGSVLFLAVAGVVFLVFYLVAAVTTFIGTVLGFKWAIKLGEEEKAEIRIAGLRREFQID